MPFTAFGVPPARPEPSLTSVTNSGNNTATTAWGISRPAQAPGDMVITGLVSDADVTHGTLPGGPNGETAVTIAGATGGVAQRISVWYWIATDSATAGTFTVVPSASEQWTASVAIVPRDNFDTTTPVGEGSFTNSTAGTETSAPITAFTAGATDGGGLLCAWIGVDTDPVTAGPTGWVDDASVDRGAVSGTLSHRTILVRPSESVPAVSWVIAGDSSTTRAFIIRAP